MAQPNDAGLGGGKLDAAQVAKMDALRAAMQAKAAQYAAPTRPQPAKPATSSTAYNPLSSANTGLPAARKVGTTLAPTAEEALRQRQAAPAPVAPARPVIPTVAPRPSGTTSAAYNPLSSANTGRPAPQPLPTRGYNYTESDTASGQPAYMRRQEIDRAQMAAQAAALANAQRQQAQQAQQAQPGHVRAQELPALTDPPAGWWTPAVDWSNPTNAVRLTGRPPERPTFPAQPPQLSNLLPYGPETLWMNPALVPGISPGVRQYIADRDLARTTPGGDAWVNYSQQAEAERARAAEAERFAAMGLPTTYMPYSEEELRAMASRPDRFNPIFAAGSHLADQVGYGFEKEVSTEPIPFTERTDEQGNPIPNTYVSIGGGLNIFVNALTKAYEIGTAGRNLVFQSQMGNETRARAAEEQIDELVAAAVPALTANVEALRDVNAAIADAAEDAAGPALGPQPEPATPPPTLYDWLGEAKRNFGIVPIGPKTLDQALLVAARDPDYMSPMTINGINTAITDINRQMILDAQAAQRMANVRPMTYGEWSAEAPTFYDALERLGIVNGQGVPYPEMATVIASSGAENQKRVLENFEMKAKLPLIRELRNQMLWAGTESGTALALSLNSLIMRLETSTYSELVDLETNLPMELLDNFLLDPLNMFDFPLGKVAEAHLLNKTLDAVGGLRTLDNADDLANLSKVFRDVYKPWLEGGRVGEIVLPASLPADLAKLLPTADELRGPQNFLSRMIARTPETRAHLATNNIWMAMANVLHGVDNADDAILILRTISDNPEQMIQGVAGLTSPAFVKIADENGLVRWGPGVMSNPTFVREMPIFQAGAAEVIARLEKARDEAMKAAKKAKTLYDGTQHHINPLELMADLHREWDRAARQLLGITPIQPPTGATKLALHDLADGTAQVEWLDDANKVIKQFPAQPLTKAQEQLAVLQAATQKAKENPLRKGLRTSANIQRSFMSDMWLNMPPRHWNRNAAAATLATSVDGLYSFKTTDEALGTLGKKFVEGRATERLTESVSGAGALGNVSNQNWTRGFWPKHNPYAWMMERGAEMWTGTKQIAGRIPYGEQSFYIKAYDRGFSRLFDADWKTLTRRELEPLIRSWNVDPVVGKAILDKIIETGQMGSKADVAQVARQITHGAAEPFSLRNLGIANEVIPPENGRRILEAVNTLGRTVPGQPAETVEAAIQRVANLIRAQFDQMRNRPGAMLWEAMPAPTPVEHLADEAINTVTLVDDALRDAREAGITDPAQLAIFEQEAQEYARRLVEGETTGWEGVLDELANAPDNPAGMAASFDLLSQVYELKRMARQEVDELMAPVRAAHTKAEKDAAWLAKFAGTADIYTKLADDLQATFAGSLVTLRRIAAGEDAPQQRDWWDVITRYLDFDARDNLLTRSQDFGDMMQEDPAIVQKFIDANRSYVDSSYIQLYDIFRRYPSLDSLDMLRMAQKQIDAEGARAAAFLKTQRNRIKHFDEATKQMVGDLTKAEYYVIRNDTWRELFDNQVIFNQAAARAIAGHALAMESPTKLIWTDDFIGGTFQLIGPAADDQVNAAIRLTVDDLFERGAFDAATGKIADKYLAPKPLPRVVKGKSKPKWAMTPEETETYLKALAVTGVTEWRDDGWYLVVRDADAAQQMVQERGKFAWLARNVETGEIEIFGSPNPMAPIAPGTGGTARVPGAVMQDFEALVRGEPFPTRPAAPSVPPAAAATPPTPPVAPAAPPAAAATPAPTKITKEMRKQLYDLRYRKADIAGMTPADAQRIIDSGVTRTGEVRKGAWKEALTAETPPSPAQPRQAAQAENAVSEATAPADAAQPPAAPAGEAVSEAAPAAEAPAGYRNAFTPEQAARHGLPPEAATGAPSLEPTTPRDVAPANVPTVPQEVLDAKATQSDSALWEQAIDAEIGKATPIEPRPVDDVIPDGVAPQEWTDAKASVDAERQAIAAEADIAQPFVLRLDDVEEMAGGEALPAAQVGPSLEQPTQVNFRAFMQRAYNLDEQGADAVDRIARARSRIWAQQTGRNASEWVPEYLAGIVRGGEPGEGALYQALDYNTPEFKAWFGNSKAATDGVPIKMYHGTASDFEEFRPSIDGAAGPGIYMTPNPGKASGFADRDGGRVIQVYASIQNPYILKTWDDTMNAKQLNAYARANGYDGLYIPWQNEWVAFEPNQIKSVFNTRPTQDPRLLYQSLAGELARGSTEFLDDGRAILRGLEAPDISTAAHEMGHVFRRDLAKVARQNERARADVAIMNRWAGVGLDGVWTTEAEEKFARGFESYLKSGKAPSPELQGVFERFKQWLTEIYRALRGDSNLAEITPEMRGVYDRLLAEAPAAPIPAPVARPPVTAGMLNQLAAGAGIATAKADGTPTHRHLINAINKDARLNNAGWSIPQGMKFTDWVTDNPDRAEQAAEWLATRVENAAKLQPAAPKAPRPKKAKAAKAAAQAPTPSPAFLPDLAQDVDFRAPLPPAIQKRMGAEGNGYMDWRRGGVSGGGFPVQPQIETGVPGRPYTPPANGNGVPTPALPPGGSGGGYPWQAPIETGVPGRPYTNGNAAAVKWIPPADYNTARDLSGVRIRAINPETGQVEGAVIASDRRYDNEWISQQWVNGVWSPPEDHEAARLIVGWDTGKTSNIGTANVQSYAVPEPSIEDATRAAFGSRSLDEYNQFVDDEIAAMLAEDVRAGFGRTWDAPAEIREPALPPGGSGGGYPRQAPIETGVPGRPYTPAAALSPELARLPQAQQDAIAGMIARAQERGTTDIQVNRIRNDIAVSGISGTGAARRRTYGVVAPDGSVVRGGGDWVNAQDVTPEVLYRVDDLAPAAPTAPPSPAVTAAPENIVTPAEQAAAGVQPIATNVATVAPPNQLLAAFLADEGIANRLTEYRPAIELRPELLPQMFENWYNANARRVLGDIHQETDIKNVVRMKGEALQSLDLGVADFYRGLDAQDAARTAQKDAARRVIEDAILSDQAALQSRIREAERVREFYESGAYGKPLEEGFRNLRSTRALLEDALTGPEYSHFGVSKSDYVAQLRGQIAQIEASIRQRASTIPNEYRDLVDDMLARNNLAIATSTVAPPNPARASFLAGADLTTRQRAQDLLDAKPRPRIDTQTRREMVEAEHAQGLTAEQRGGLWYIGDRQVTTTETEYLRHLQTTPAAAPYTEPVANTATAAPAVPGHRYLGVNRYDEPIYERVTDGERIVVRNGIGMIEDADGGNHFRFITQEEAATPAAATPPAAALPAPGVAEAVEAELSPLNTVYTAADGSQWRIYERPAENWHGAPRVATYHIEVLEPGKRKPVNLSASSQSTAGAVNIVTEHAAERGGIVSRTPVPTPKTAKYNHEKTLAEFTQERLERTRKQFGGNLSQEQIAGNAYWAKEEHRPFVERALAEGKPVSPEVLADYPELAARQAPAVPTTPAPAAGEAVAQAAEGGEIPTVADYSAALRNAIENKTTSLSPKKFDEQIATYASADDDMRRFLADEIGAKFGDGGTARVPTGWKEVESPASAGAFTNIDAPYTTVVDGKYYLDPNREQWVRGRLASSGYIIEDAGTMARVEAEANRFARPVNTITVKAPVIDTPVQQVGLGELEGLPLATGEPIIPEAGTAGIPRNRDEFVRMATQFDDEIEELDTQRYIYGQLDATEYNRRLDDIEQRRADMFVALGLDAKDDPVQAAARAFPDWDKMLAPFGEQVKPLFREAMGLGEWSPRTVVDEAFPESAIVDAKAWKRQDIDFDLIDALNEYRLAPEDQTAADRIGDLLFRAVLDDVITPESAKAFWPGLAKDVDEIIARRAMEQADDAAYAAAKAAEAAPTATTPAQPAMRQAWQMTQAEFYNAPRTQEFIDTFEGFKVPPPQRLTDVESRMEAARKAARQKGVTDWELDNESASATLSSKTKTAAFKNFKEVEAEWGQLYDGAIVEWQNNLHRAIVEDALRKGQPVPANVLAEYPDLAAKAPGAAEYVDENGVKVYRMTRDQILAESAAQRARFQSAEAAQQAAEQARQYTYNGFLEPMSPMRRQKVANTLETKVRYNGQELLSRRSLVERKIDEGATVIVTPSGERRLMSPDNSFMLEQDISKTGMDYAEYLAKRGPGYVNETDFVNITPAAAQPATAAPAAAVVAPTPAALPYNDFLTQQRAYIKQRYPSATEDAITTQMADWRAKWRDAVEETAKTQPIPESVIDSYIREFGESAFNSRFRGVNEFVGYEIPRVRAEGIRSEAIRNGAQFFVAKTDDAAEKARITKLTKNLDGLQEFSIDAGRAKTMKRRRYVEEEFLAGTPLTQTEWTGPRGAKNTAWKIGANTVNDQQVEYYRYLEQQRAALLAKQDTNKTYRTPAAVEAATTPAPAPTPAPAAPAPTPTAALPNDATRQAKAKADLQEFIRSAEARFKQTLPDTPEVAALKQQIIDAEIEFRRRVVQQEEMHAAFERATDRKQAEELRRAWWDYGHGPDGPSAANDVAQTAKVELSSILDGMARQAEGDARAAMSPRDRLLGDMKKAAARTGSDTSHAWSSFDLNAAIKRMEDNPDLPVVELTVETPMTTATKTKPAVPNVGADKFNKAETDAMRAQLEYAAGILERNEASVVVIKYGRSQMAFATPEQARSFAKSVGALPSATAIPGYTNLSVRGGGFAGMIGNTDAGAFEVWENVIPMQGRAMAPQVDLLDNVAEKYSLGKMDNKKNGEIIAVREPIDGQMWYTDGNIAFRDKPKTWTETFENRPAGTTLQGILDAYRKPGNFRTELEPLGLVRFANRPAIILGTEDGKIKAINAKYYAGVMQAANGKPVTWGTRTRKGDAVIAMVDGEPIAILMGLSESTRDEMAQIAKYFYPTTTPNLTLYGGLGAVDPRPAINDIYQTMIKYWRKPKQPEIGDMALHQVTTLNDAEDRILEALPRLAQPRRNNMTSAQANAFIDAIDRRLLPAFDDAVSRAGYGAQKMADAAMLNYRDRRGLDANLALFVPYHYFYTRGGLTWLRRMARKPSTANMYYDIQKAINTENLQTGVPERLKGTIPIWTFENGSQLRMSNPLNSMMPFNMYVPDPFQTQEGDTDAERAWTALKNMIPGLLPVYDVAAAAAFDMIDPLPNGDSRVARYTNLRNYIPPAGSAADMALAQFGVITPANLGGDPFDWYRVKRQASFDAQSGAISDEIADYVIQLTVNLEGNDPDPWANIPADKMAEVRAAYIDAAKQAGRDKLLMGGGVGYMLGANLYNFPAAERQLLSAQDLWRYSGYGEQNPMGSAAQRQAVMQMYPALGAYMARSTQPGSLYQPGQQAQANALYNQLDPLYAQQAAIEDNLINATGGGVSGTALSNATKPIQQEIDALRAQYPDIPEPSGRPASGSNPQEMARWMLRQAVPQGGPTWPGENATKAEKAAYYDARSAWEKERLATFERNLQTIIAGSDPTQDDITFEMFKLMAGKDAPTLLREYGPGYYDSPTKIAYDTRNDVRTQAETARYDAAEALILREFGPAGLDVYKTYAVTEDADREAYKAAHPELKALNFAAYNPNEYAAAVALFGKDAIMQWANLPPSDGSEAAAKVRAEYYDANPGAYLMNAWMNGRPTPYGETLGPWTTLPAKWGMEYQSDYGKDFAEAMTKFGADIWQIAAGYKRGWTSKEKAAYFDKYPQLSDFFDWWNDLLPDDNKASSSGWKSYSSYYKRSSSYRKRYYSSRRSYGRRSYGGGGGYGGYYNGGGNEKPVYIDNVYAREFDRNLWNTFSNEIRKWEPPRADATLAERWRPARYWSG